MEEPDLAKTLSELPKVGADDYVAQVLAIYQRTMLVYETAEQAYEKTLRAAGPVSHLSTSTNY